MDFKLRRLTRLSFMNISGDWMFLSIRYGLCLTEQASWSVESSCEDMEDSLANWLFGG